MELANSEKRLESKNTEKCAETKDIQGVNRMAEISDNC